MPASSPAVACQIARTVTVGYGADRRVRSRSSSSCSSSGSRFDFDTNAPMAESSELSAIGIVSVQLDAALVVGVCSVVTLFAVERSFDVGLAAEGEDPQACVPIGTKDDLLLFAVDFDGVDMDAPHV